MHSLITRAATFNPDDGVMLRVLELWVVLGDVADHLVAVWIPHIQGAVRAGGEHQAGVDRTQNERGGGQDDRALLDIAPAVDLDCGAV